MAETKETLKARLYKRAILESSTYQSMALGSLLFDALERIQQLEKAMSKTVDLSYNPNTSESELMGSIMKLEYLLILDQPNETENTNNK